MDDEILRAVVVLSGEVTSENRLGAIRVALLRIERRARHVRDHGVATAKGVFDSTQGVFRRGGLGEPHIASVAGKMAGLEGSGYSIFVNDGAAGGVDEVGSCIDMSAKGDMIPAGTSIVTVSPTLLHLANQLRVEEASGALVQRAVDGHDVAACEQLIHGIDALAPNLLLLVLAERLVVKVEELLAVEASETTQDTLSNTADAHCSDNLALQIILLLSSGGDIPLTTLYLFMSRNKVANQDEDGHDDVLSDGYDIAAGDFGDGDTAVRLVGGIEVDMVRTDAGCDG